LQISIWPCLATAAFSSNSAILFSQGSEFQFAEQALPATGISRGRYAQLEAWQVKDLRYFIDKVTGAGISGEANRAVFQLIVKRRSGFYVWKLFVPLLIMTMIPAVVFWIDVKEFDWTLKERTVEPKK
jgi:hypothetical protein